MKSFTDEQGREWSLRLTLNTDRRVFEAVGVYLSDLSDEPTLDRICNEMVLLGDIVWVMIEKQAAERGLSKNDFLEDLRGDVLESALEAVIQETLDFLGSRGRAIKTARANRLRIQKELDEMNLAGMEGMTGEDLYKLLASSLAVSTGLPGSAAESAGSTPVSSRSANSTPCDEAETETSGGTPAV